jgi:hypothetical protein
MQSVVLALDRGLDQRSRKGRIAASRLCGVGSVFFVVSCDFSFEPRSYCGCNGFDFSLRGVSITYDIPGFSDRKRKLNRYVLIRSRKQFRASRWVPISQAQDQLSAG